MNLSWIKIISLFSVISASCLNVLLISKTDTCIINAPLHWLILKMFRTFKHKKVFPFATSVIYHLGSYFFHENYKIIWNAAALVVWEGTYLCSTCDFSSTAQIWLVTSATRQRVILASASDTYTRCILWNIAVSLSYSCMFKEARFAVFTIAFTKLIVRFKEQSFSLFSVIPHNAA